MKYLKNKKILFWIIIFLITSFTRLFKLAEYPVSLNVDEVSIGYDAFSILKTGRDHYGNFLPITFRSIGDYKNGVYIYMVTISQAFFGINEFSVRFPSAFFGILFVFVAFIFAQQIFIDKKIPYILVSLISISPWHIRFSRGAYEANVALTILFFSIFLFLKKIEQKKSPFVPILLMIFSAYTYHSEKIIVPVLLCFLFIFYIHKIIFSKKQLIWQLIIILIFSIPLTLNLLGKNQSRNNSVLANKDPEIIAISNESNNFNSFDNQYMMFYSSVRRYFQYLDPSFLFIKGLDLTQHVNLNQGPFYLIEFPFFIFGFSFLIIKNKKLFKQKSFFYFFCLLIVVSIVPAAITLNDYHLIRSYTLIFPFLCLIAIGITRLIKKTSIIVIVLFLYFLSFVSFSDYYLVHFTKQRDEWIFYPSKDLALTVIENLNKYDQIIVDPAFGKLGPYTQGIPDIYILFYGKIPPNVLWQKETNELNKISYRHIEWFSDKKFKKTLLIGSPWSLPQKDIKNESIKKIILYNNGSPAYLVVDTNNE